MSTSKKRTAEGIAAKRAAHERWRKSPEGIEYLKNYRKRPAVQNRIRADKRKHHSGWTAEAFEASWTTQDGDCALCGCAMCPTGILPTSVAADHTERDGVKIPRALLCMICNRALGFYEQHQRVTGFRIEPYELYLAAHP